MNMAKIDEWLSSIPSPQTRKSYKNGVRAFEKYLGAEIDSVMAQDDTILGHTLEKFYVHLKDSGRNYMNPYFQKKKEGIKYLSINQT